MRLSVWPRGLVGRVGFVLFAAILLEFAGSSIFIEHATLLMADTTAAQRIGDGLDPAMRICALTAPVNRAAVVKTLSQPDFTLAWRTGDTSTPGDQTVRKPADASIERLRRHVIETTPELRNHDLAIHTEGSEIVGNARLDDGSLLLFRTPVQPAGFAHLFDRLWSIGLLSGGVLFAALMVVRTLAAPLRMLVGATDAIGHGPVVQIQEDRGPREVRRVARAFNAMQTRIAKLLEDRTAALAAVSHDLRTPIARMRLRAGFLERDEDRLAFEADLAEMEAMLGDLLAYLGGETDPEKARKTNLAAILASLVDAASDMGGAANYEGPDRIPLVIRPLAVKRAFSNVINNAVAYGGSASVRASVGADAVHVVVEDRGPGIPEAEQAAVFEPFYRVDASRNRQKGGMGLGLAIARQVFARERGTITLANRPDGGLAVTVTLPLS